MSTQGDEIVFENSVANNDEPSYFNEKKYNFITDSSNGNFSSGQVSFDLSTFSSSQFLSLPEAIIELPLKITASLTTVSAGSTPGTSSAGILSAICKSGFHNWVSSAQLIVNGQTIASQQPYANVSATYRILSNWSNDTLNKWGDSCGIAIDDCTADSEVSTSYATNIGLSNTLYSDIVKSNRGFDTTNNQDKIFNKGTSSRVQLLNNNVASNTTGISILGTAGYKNAGKANVASASGANDTATRYSQFVMATLRVRDLFDINEFPLVKNLKGYLYINFNSSQVQLSSATGIAGVVGIDALTVNIQQQTGNTCPFTINYSPSGVQLNSASSAGITTAPVMTIVGTVSSSSEGAITGSSPLINSARLIMPYYTANPTTDTALSKIQRFKTLEQLVNPFNIARNTTTNYTITVGVSSPRKLVLLPMWQSAGGYSLPNPELSCFDQTPVTSGVFAKLDNLQVYVSNKPLFQYPLQYDYENWVMNCVEQGANAGLVDEMTSGLLTQQLWEQNHRFYAFNLSRGNISDDGMSRSVQITCTNPSSQLDMKVIAILFYEKNWEINTATCQIVSA